MKFSKLKYLVLDIDGTLTDGGIYYDEYGNELKKFCTKDAAGIFAAHKLGIKIVVITGRECMATKKRMEELKVDYIFQNKRDKTSFLMNFMQEKGIKKEELGYIGDDINDKLVLAQVGLKACPYDAHPSIKSIEGIICLSKNGGEGAVREFIDEYILKKVE